jgi:hypothetical protein
VGETTANGVRVGEVEMPTEAKTSALPGRRRVQILFRPDDVAVERDRSALAAPVLGEGVVEQTSFAGAQERLLLRLPAVAGVRTIAPPVAYGSDHFLVEASRTPHAAHRTPLRPGDRAWVGVRRIHVLAHPGLNFLMVTTGSPEDRAAVTLGAEIAARAQARVSLLAVGAESGEGPAGLLRETAAQIGAGLTIQESRAAVGSPSEVVAAEASRRPYDLVVLGWEPRNGWDVAGAALAAGAEHLLLVPGPSPVPARVLVCVAVGEPGKRDVAFAARLVRHLGAEATVMTVLPGHSDDAEARDAAHRFVEGGARTLMSSGVRAEARVRTGDAEEQIRGQIVEGRHDLLVLGSPLPRHGDRPELRGLLRRMLEEGLDRPVLIVRSAHRR